ncbi:MULTISPECIES: hypothetical protein [Paenibacillus]|uniref:Methyltransferase n=2 Tax=Paenibacillus TaxID=44249 RepID=A0ABS4NR83_9BACL|nr:MULTISPECIES: hypothetical protein [Paenibacillus]ETT70229.1 hypothetical protein C173_16161 [Paenibacillus sp. FSL R7-277]MBP2112576.1 hypothetical protein [Paenibacillus silagei]OMF96780.1 hypothetical protein BK146_14245 [Paenibacillus sp. FSL R7-0333]
MARSWERMVQRNTKQINQQRKKQGKDSIYTSSTKTAAKSIDIFKGRNIVFPVVLMLLGIMFWVVGSIDEAKGSGILANWLGVVLYFLLAALLFFRRPFLKVERARISTIKYNRERFLAAADIEKITLSRSVVTIKYKGKRKQWIFSKLINRYDTAAMGERLEQFAKNNNIEVVHE